MSTKKFGDVFKMCGRTPVSLVLDVLSEQKEPLYPHQICDAKALGYGDRRIRETEVREALEYLATTGLADHVVEKYAISKKGADILELINEE